MKKVIIILLIVMSIFLIKKEKIVPVSYLELPFKADDYNVFYLDLENENITTKNILDIIGGDIQIISIKPYINPIYGDKVDLKYNFISGISNKKNINDFINYYKDTLKKTNYIDDVSYINEIKINEITIYARGYDIINILKDKNIKYKQVFKGEYIYLEV